MGSMRNHEELIEILDRNTSWIENCDSKTSIILGGIGVITGVLLATDYVVKLAAIYKHMAENISFWSVAYLIGTILSIGAIIVGCLFLISVLMAKVDPTEFSKKGLKMDSLIFFSTIAQNKSFAKYREKLQKCPSLDDDIISQIYICSLICEKKFALYKKGLIISLLGFMAFVILTFVGLIIV